MSDQTRRRNRLQVQQLLFGYARGHTLLAASGARAKSLSSALLSNSDWDPRTIPGIDSYVSGQPVLGEKTYALMRTWRAPEMPRPGCVWTHVLLLDDADLSRISNLRSLEKLFKRPEEKGGFNTYSSTLDVELTELVAHDGELDPRIVADLINITYLGANRSHKGLLDTDDLVDSVLAIWSQQWPALRRKFSFRTAPLTTKKPTSKTDFDLEILGYLTPADQQHSHWQNLASTLLIDDLLKRVPSDLGRFLWRYGADTTSNPVNILKITYIYQLLVDEAPNSTSIMSVIEQIADWFVHPNDAGLLKSDIVRSAESKFSTLPKLDQLEVAFAVRTNDKNGSFPEIGSIRKQAVESWIENRSKEAQDLFCIVADDQSDFADSLYAGLSGTKHADFIWKLWSKSRNAFLRASRTCHDHLVDQRIDELEAKDLLSILKERKTASKDLEKIVPYLLNRRDHNLISFLVEFFSEAVTAAVINRISTRIGDEAREMNPNLVQYVKQQSDHVVKFAKETATLRSQLLVCRYMLDADLREYPLAVWSSRLLGLKNDLGEQDDLEFRVFFLIQTIKAPQEGALLLLKDAFDPIYEALGRRSLPFRTEMQLIDSLPYIGIFNNWDKCLRLKIASVAVGKALGLRKRDFLAISADVAIREELNELWAD
jgi:hypothetical protein